MGEIVAQSKDSLSLQFRLTRRDYASMWAASFRGRNVRSMHGVTFRIISALLCAAMYCGVALSMMSELSDVQEFEPKAFWALISFIVAAGLYLLAMITQSRLVSRLQLWDNGFALREHTFQIDSKGIRTSNSLANSSYSWLVIVEITVFRQLCLLRLDGAMFLCVPRSAFEMEEQFREFELRARTWMDEARSTHRAQPR